MSELMLEEAVDALILEFSAQLDVDSHATTSYPRSLINTGAVYTYRAVIGLLEQARAGTLTADALRYVTMVEV